MEAELDDGGGGCGGIGMSPALTDKTNTKTKTRESKSLMMSSLLSRQNTTKLVTGVTNRVLGLCEAGHYDEAQAVLGDGPLKDGTPDLLFGYGLIACGTGKQSLAKDLFTRAIEGFGGHPLADRCLIGLSVAYYLSGEVTEAAAYIDSVPADSPFRFAALNQKAILERDPKRQLEILGQAEPFADNESHAMRGRFHNQRGMTLRRIADDFKKHSSRSKANDYRTRAAMEYEAALFHFGEAGADALSVVVLNNLVGLYTSGGRYAEAHCVADKVLGQLNRGTLHYALALDQKAQTFLAEGRATQARQYCESAVSTLQRGERAGALAECLITLGSALAVLQDAAARTHLDRAITIAEHLGDLLLADRARIVIIGKLPIDCQDAFRLFSQIHNSFVAAARALIHRVEAEAIRSALKEHNGSVVQAAEDFDVTHQGLAKRIQTHFPYLLEARKPKRTRRWKTKPR